MKFLMFFLLTMMITEAVMASAHPWREEDLRDGYSENLIPEQEGVGEILYIVDSPYRNEVRISERIFDPKLTKDITQRYQEKFGRTEVEIIQTRTPYLTSNFSEGASFTFNESEYQKQQQSFGKYVAKRVAEYHFEKEAKDNSDLQGAYQAKHALENMSATMGQLKIRARYRIASNSILFLLKNPYVNLEARVEMSGEKEKVYSLSKDFAKEYSVLLDYYATNPRLDFVTRKNLSRALYVSLTYTPYKDIPIYDGLKIVKIEESLAMAGLSYSF